MTEDQSRNASTVTVLRAALERRLTELHTAIPARVESYDTSKQTADVQPLVQALAPQEGGGTVAENLPVLSSVPVAWPGAGGMRLILPLKKGDTGYVMFCEASIDNWQANGGIVDPGDSRRFHLADAWFVPGLKSDAQAAWKGDNGDDASFGKDGAHQVVITPDNVELGGNADDRPSDFVALASLVKKGLDKLHDAMNSGFGNIRTSFNSISSHTHNVETAGTAVKQSGTTLPSTSLSSLSSPQDVGTIDDVKSSIVKSK